MQPIFSDASYNFQEEDTNKKMFLSMQPIESELSITVPNDIVEKYP